MKYRILAVVMVVAILFSLGAIYAFAQGQMEIEVVQIEAEPGELVTVPVIIKNNPGIAGLRCKIYYDNTALTFVSAQKGEIMNSACSFTNKNYPNEGRVNFILSYATNDKTKNLEGDGVLFTIQFRVSDTAKGKLELNLQAPADDILNAMSEVLPCVLTSGTISVGSDISFDISGVVTSYGAADGEVTVQLKQGDTEIASTVTTDGTYKLTSVAPGTYSLVVSKLNHRSKTYEITVADESITQDVTIHLSGDINGDGDVDNKDVTRLFQYLSDWDVDVVEDVLDVNGDDSVDNKDLTRLFQYLSDWDVEIY